MGILIFVIISFTQGYSSKIDLLLNVFQAAGYTLLIESLIFKRIIWRLAPNLFYSWLCPIPFIGGKWEGVIYSDYIYPDTGIKGEHIHVYMNIKHGFDKILITMETDRSFSSSYISNIWVDSAGQEFLYYTYENNVDQNQDTNPKHIGTVRLRILKNLNNEIELNGHYFTNRKTSGKITLKKSETIAKRNTAQQDNIAN